MSPCPPHPLHLCLAITQSLHYHCGLLNGDPTPPDGKALGRAMERLAERCAAHIKGLERVLDVGCGMGGTAAMLSARGHRVVGLDPSVKSVAFARSALGERDGLEFRVGSFPIRKRETFDALVFVEVRQHFPCLDELLQQALTLLAPGGRMVLCDPVLYGHRQWSPEAPFHPEGAMAQLAREAELLVVSETSWDDQVLAWLEAFLKEISAYQDRLAEGLGDCLELTQVNELSLNARFLAHALARREAGYEEVVIEVPQR